MARRAVAMSALALLCAPGGARALGWNLQLNPGWNAGTTSTTDETGHHSRSEFEAWVQRYRLNVDQEIMPRLTLSAGGNFEWLTGTAKNDGERTSIESQTWNGFASLRWGAKPVGGGVDYTRREQVVDVTSTSGASRLPALVRETYGASLSLTPAELPSLDVQVYRADTYDRSRVLQDLTTDTLNLGVRYAPVKQLELGYGLGLFRSEDRISGVETTGWTNSFSARYADTFADGRVQTYANYSAATRVGGITAHKPGGSVTNQVFPTSGGGYSKVETPSDLPTRVVLNPNGDLVDGNLSARAGLNLGWGAFAVGDRANRDMGAQFPNVVTSVDAIDVYVDKSLPASVAATFTWTAYQTDDNQAGTWTPVTVIGTVTFDPLLNRFRIPIVRTAARFLKVVTQPLAPSVSTDQTLQEINVTELQFYQVLSIAEAQAKASSLQFSESVTESTKVVLIRELNLAYDVAATLTHTVDPSLVTWTVTNGLGLANPITPTLSYALRTDRTDSDVGQGHLGQTRWSASLTSNPLPTLGGTLSYSGQRGEERVGTSLSNAVNATAHADLYEGIALGATSSAAVTDSANGRRAVGATAGGSLSLVPNRTLTLSGSINYSWTEQTGGGQEKMVNRTGVVEGSAGYSPFPALAFSGTLRRLFLGDTPTTFGSFSAGLSPFRGGDLQVRYAYAATFDTATETRTRSHGPSLRWNIRPGWYTESGASWNTTTTPAQSVDSTGYFVNLVLNIK